jgi:hypothetical protein
MEMKLVSKFMKGMVEKILKKIIKKSFGVDVDIYLSDFYMSTDDSNTTHIHMNANAKIAKKDLEMIVDKI